MPGITIADLTVPEFVNRVRRARESHLDHLESLNGVNTAKQVVELGAKGKGVRYSLSEERASQFVERKSVNK